MAYRNGTYVAFHAQGNADASQSDMKYYRMMQAWHEHDGIEFKMNDSHSKASQVRDTSSRETLRKSLRERLSNSRNMVLICSATTQNDNDWVPEEIEYAIDVCEIPLIIAYPGYNFVTTPSGFRPWWPTSLTTRIDSGTAKCIHVPFKQVPLNAAIDQFHHDNLPNGSLVRYSDAAYANWGIPIT